jgi:hypothetical protein
MSKTNYVTKVINGVTVSRPMTKYEAAAKAESEKTKTKEVSTGVSPTTTN